MEKRYTRCFQLLCCVLNQRNMSNNNVLVKQDVARDFLYFHYMFLYTLSYYMFQILNFLKESSAYLISWNNFKPLLKDVQIKNVLSVISCYFFITCMFVRSVIGNCSNIWKEFLHENISLQNISKQRNFIYLNFLSLAIKNRFSKLRLWVHT